MLDRLMCWWMWSPTHQDMGTELWRPFRETVSGWLLWVWLVSTALIVLAYWIWTRMRKVETPDGLFSPYAPLGVLWFVAVPAVFLFLKCRNLHDELVGLQWHSYAVVPAVKCALWGAGLVFVSSYLLMLVPGVTPPLYRYRPMAWLLRWKVRRARASVG
jgi:hypothetical protein